VPSAFTSVLTRDIDDELRNALTSSPRLIRGSAIGDALVVSEVKPAGVSVFIGMSPNSGFVSGVIETDAWGFIQADASFQTSMPGVFAAGDVRSGSTKQLASTGEGVTLLIMVCQYLQGRGDLPVKVAESM
jgi:thioredoxin reductase